MPRSVRSATDVLDAARSAFEQQHWQDAYERAVAAGEQADRGTEADRLDLLADAAWWLGRLAECTEAREKAYAAYLDAGNACAAGQCAVWLYEHSAFLGRPAAAGAWLRRARRALDGNPDCKEYGALVLREAETTHGSGQLDAALRLAEDVVELARRLQSADLEGQALQTRGRILIDRGDVTEGMADMDEAMLLAVEGKLDAYSTGKVYCSLISACDEVGDLRRAAEWTEATTGWAQRHPYAVFPGLCRVHRAHALHWQGAWTDAEREARRAAEELVEVNVGNAAAAYAEIGEIRRRLGDFEAAEQAFAQAEQLCGRPPPGLALLRLAQGRVTTAVTIITQALEDDTWNRLSRARLLAIWAQVAGAAGDNAAATKAVEQLEQVAADYGSPMLQALAATARGRVQLADGESSAGATLRRAVRLWQELDVPYEVATARMLLGLACRDAGDDEGARSSFLAAAATFQQLGAAPDVREAQELCAPTTTQLPGGLTEREAQVLCLVAAGRSNRAIAEELWLSHKTVARHLSNIFAKIGVSSRVAATAFAYEHDLVSGDPPTG